MSLACEGDEEHRTRVAEAIRKHLQLDGWRIEPGLSLEGDRLRPDIRRDSFTPYGRCEGVSWPAALTRDQLSPRADRQTPLQRDGMRDKSGTTGSNPCPMPLPMWDTCPTA